MCLEWNGDDTTVAMVYLSYAMPVHKLHIHCTVCVHSNRIATSCDSTSPDSGRVEVLLEECLQFCLCVILIKTNHLRGGEGEGEGDGREKEREEGVKCTGTDMFSSYINS